MRHASWRAGILGWVLVGLVPAAFAQDTNIAKALEDARAAAETARTAAADPAREVSAVVVEFDRAAGLYEVVLDASPDEPESWSELGQLLVGELDFLSRRSEGAEAHFAAAKRAAGRAVECFRRVADIYRSYRSKTDVDPDADWGRRRAEFREALCHYQLAKVLATGDPAWHAEAEMAVEMQDEFLWENEENLLGGYACLYRGLCLGMLDRPDEAVEWLRNVCGIAVPDEAREECRAWTDLMLQAYFKLGEYCNGIGKRGETDYREIAIREIGSMTERIPDAGQRRFGQLAILERAKALLDTGKRVEAVSIALNLGRTTRRPDVAFLVDRWLAEAVERAGLDEMTPEVLFKVALAKKRDREWKTAILYFVAARAVSKTEEDRREYEIPARREIGECLYRAGEFREAYEAYRELVEFCRETDPDAAADAAYYAYRSATALFQKTRAKEDLALKRAARMRFASEYADHPRAVDLMYYEAAGRVAQADAELAGGEEPAARELYESALALLRRTRRSSALFEKARARIGEVLYKLGEFEKALGAFTEFEKTLADSEKTFDAARIANRAVARALADYYAALCHARLGQWALVLEGLDGFESRHTGPEVSAFLVPARFERARALIRLGRLREAEREAFRLAALRRGGDPARLEALLRDLSEADPSRRLSHAWWRRELLLFRRWQERLEQSGEEGAIEALRLRYRALEKEGALERSPFREQLREIYEKARDR